MSDETTHGAVRIGDLVVDAGARTVVRGAESIPLPRLSFDLLLALVEAAPDALSTDVLMERVWKGRVVSPQTIAKRVELLRQALGDDAAEPRYVELVRGYGYRLAQEAVVADRPVIDVVDDPADGNAASRRTPTTLLLATVLAVAALALLYLPRDETPATPPERSVAVLPFKAIGDQQEDQWFAEGLTEEIAHALARTGELQVTGRTSAQAFRDAAGDARDVGKALGVSYLLEGTVRRQDDRLRIVTRLTDTRDGFQEWNEVFEASADDSARLHQQVAQQVVSRFQLNPVPPGVQDRAATSSNPEAYALYLQVVSLTPWPEGEELERAQAMIEQVVELDPGFAPGWTRLAIVHGQRLFFDRTYALDPETSIRTMRSATDRALAIDPAQGEAYAVLAGIAFIFERDLERAARLIERALRLDPWNLDIVRQAVTFSRAVGELEQASALSAYVVRRDPLCATCRTAYAGALSCLGDFEGAERELKRVRDEDVGWPLAYDRGVLALEMGTPEEAARHFARIEDPAFHRLGEIQLQIARGARTQAERSLADHIADYPGHGILQAALAAKLGDVERAVALLRERLPRQAVFVQTSLCSPAYRGLEADERWQALLREAGRDPEGSQNLRLDIPPLPGRVPESQDRK
jgi:TolB-like protein/DNA-binding winged helix-turn-helix (wHTH) protein